jgi:hypothetical protein
MHSRDDDIASPWLVGATVLVLSTLGAIGTFAMIWAVWIIAVALGVA